MLVVERDIGQMSANVQCLLPARPRKIGHVNNLPSQRIGLERVSVPKKVKSKEVKMLKSKMIII